MITPMKRKEGIVSDKTMEMRVLGFGDRILLAFVFL